MSSHAAFFMTYRTFKSRRSPRLLVCSAIVLVPGEKNRLIDCSFSGRPNCMSLIVQRNSFMRFRVMDAENIDDELERIREQCRRVGIARMQRKQLVRRPSIPTTLAHLEDEEEEEKTVEEIRDACHEVALKRGPTLQQQMVAPPYNSVEEKVWAISKAYNVTEAQLERRQERRAAGRRVSFSDPLATYKEYVVDDHELYHEVEQEETQC
ncbi:hypothetical protein R1sor_003526 [Riccia sorocarpa]|uniref:Uncharacterized protein n=1 Tax=Riccia sorocarpa TaxID=122646 RepID=A0ABD3H807_9MARC